MSGWLSTRENEFEGQSCFTILYCDVSKTDLKPFVCKAHHMGFILGSWSLTAVKNPISWVAVLWQCTIFFWLHLFPGAACTCKKSCSQRETSYRQQIDGTNSCHFNTAQTDVSICLSCTLWLVLIRSLVTSWTKMVHTVNWMSCIGMPTGFHKHKKTTWLGLADKMGGHVEEKIMAFCLNNNYLLTQDANTDNQKNI